MGTGRVFVGRRAELERLLREARPASLRTVPVVVGPSGIGKTSLAREAARRLTGEGYLALHISVTQPVSSLEDLYRVLASEVGVSYSSLALGALRGLVERVLEAVYGSGWRSRLRDADALLERSVYDVLAEFFLELARRARRDGRRGVVAFIDEAQNILRSMEPGDIWGFVKMLASLQEELPSGDAAAFQAVLVTSEYGFQQRLLRHSPSPDYVDTFYLGEMTRGDAYSLYQALGERGPGTGERDFIECCVGGHPVHLAMAARRGLVDTVCHGVRKMQQIIVEHLHGLDEERRDEAGEVLRRLARQPLLRIPGYDRLLDGLVERGVLQYGCSSYLGVYDWNPDCTGDESLCGGGGWCGGLDVVAPASRMARAGLLLALGEVGALPGSVVDACGLGGVYPLAPGLP